MLDLRAEQGLDLVRVRRRGIGADGAPADEAHPSVFQLSHGLRRLREGPDFLQNPGIPRHSIEQLMGDVHFIQCAMHDIASHRGKRHRLRDSPDRRRQAALQNRVHDMRGQQPGPGHIDDSLRSCLLRRTALGRHLAAVQRDGVPGVDDSHTGGL